MSSHSLRRLARVTWLLSLVVTALALWLLLLSGRRPANASVGSLAGDLVITVAYFLAFSTIGLLASSRQPRNLVGWLLAGIGLGIGTIWLYYGYVTYSLLRPVPLPATDYVAAVGNVTYVPLSLLFALLLLTFPTGHLPSRRWRPIVWLMVLISGTGTLTGLLTAGPIYGFPEIDNPLGVESLRPLIYPLAYAAVLLVVLALVPAAIAVVVRLRTTRGIERQQMKWFAFAAVLAALVIPTSWLFAESIPPLQQYLSLLMPLLTLALPLSVGIAILKHRLYDIDLIINRTLIYGSLTLLLAGFYFGSVLLLQRVFRALTGQSSDLAIVLSTLGAAVLAQPLRSRVQTLIDRLFYRSRYDAARVTQAFAEGLTDEVHLENITRRLAGTVRATFQPEQVSVWLRKSGARSRAQGREGSGPR